MLENIVFSYISKCEQCEKTAPLVKFRSIKVCTDCEKILVMEEKAQRGSMFDPGEMSEEFDLRQEMRDDSYDY